RARSRAGADDRRARPQELAAYQLAADDGAAEARGVRQDRARVLPVLRLLVVGDPYRQRVAAGPRHVADGDAADALPVADGNLSAVERRVEGGRVDTGTGVGGPEQDVVVGHALRQQPDARRFCVTDPEPEC